MNRRGFLAGILALGVAPAVVKASSLMRVAAPAIVLPKWHAVWGPAVNIGWDPANETDEAALAILRNGEIGQVDRFTIFQTPVVEPPFDVRAYAKKLTQEFYRSGTFSDICNRAYKEAAIAGECSVRMDLDEPRLALIDARMRMLDGEICQATQRARNAVYRDLVDSMPFAKAAPVVSGVLADWDSTTLVPGKIWQVRDADHE